MLFAMISFINIRQSQNFLKEAYETYPLAHTYIESLPTELKNKPITKELQKRLIETELRAFYSFLKSIKSFDVFQLPQVFSKETEIKSNPWTFTRTSWLFELLFKRNETFNTCFERMVSRLGRECIQTEEKCLEPQAYSPYWLSYVRNPVGKRLLRRFEWQGRVEALNKRWKEIKSFEF